MVAIAVFAIYFTLPFDRALGDAGDASTVATQLGLPGRRAASRPTRCSARRAPRPTRRPAHVLKIYVGLLAATILFIATNAGVIGASRITYAMAGYRQCRRSSGGCTRSSRRRGSRSSCFAGFISILVAAAGQDRLPRDDVLVRRDALVHDRARVADPAAAQAAGRGARVAGAPELRFRGVDWPLFAVVGVLGTGLGVARRRHPVPEHASSGSADRGSASSSTSSTGASSSRSRCARRARAGRVRKAAGARVPHDPRPDRARLPVRRGDGLACRLAAERRATIVAVTAIQVPLDCRSIPICPRTSRRRTSRSTRRALSARRTAFASSAVSPVPGTSGTRSVDEAVRRGSEVIVMAGPRRVRLQRGRRQIFGDAVDFVLRHAPCRVMVATAGETAG